MNFNLSVSTILLSLFFSIHINAQQNIGHLNYGTLLSLMPESKTADSQLNTYTTNLTTQLENEADLFRKDYEKTITKMQAGQFSPQEVQTEEARLAKKQQELIAKENKINQDIQVKRNSLLQPIVQKADKVIAEVAQERGLDLIVDTSVLNSVLFADESEDVISYVLAKMGIDINE